MFFLLRVLDLFSDGFMASGRRSEAKPDKIRTDSPDETVSVDSFTDAGMDGLLMQVRGDVLEGPRETGQQDG